MSRFLAQPRRTIQLLLSLVTALLVSLSLTAPADAAAHTTAASSAAYTTNASVHLAHASTAVTRALASVGHASAVCSGGSCSGLCDHVAAYAWGHAHSGFVDANAHWAYSLAHGKAHPGSRSIPAGALMFWNTGPYGHVAIYVGNGYVITPWADAHGKVNIRKISAATISAAYHGYRGWATPVFRG